LGSTTVEGSKITGASFALPGRANFVEDIANVTRNRARTDAKGVGNLAVTLATGKQPQHFDFAC
jgi:hypothetical protein